MTESQRKGHATLQRDSRLLKARKIVRLIGEGTLNSASRVLEVGCGSGVISSALYEIGQGKIEVHAVDVTDNRVETNGYTFQKVSGTQLPYPDDSFDIVITNHVIEHVGDRSEQINHLRELKRVMKPSGVIYFAMPNKWRFVEPHYHIALLSWLPQRASDLLVRRSGRGDYYDCRPLGLLEIRKMFSECSLRYCDSTVMAIRATLEIEHPNSLLTRVTAKFLPDWALALSLPVMSTFIYLLGEIPAKSNPGEAG